MHRAAFARRLVIAETAVGESAAGVFEKIGIFLRQRIAVQALAAVEPYHQFYYVFFFFDSRFFHVGVLLWFANLGIIIGKTSMLLATLANNV